MVTKAYLPTYLCDSSDSSDSSDSIASSDNSESSDSSDSSDQNYFFPSICFQLFFLHKHFFFFTENVN